MKPRRAASRRCLSPRTEAAKPGVEISASGQKEGAYFIDGGKVFRRVAGISEEQTVNAAGRAKLVALLGIRDIVNELLRPPGTFSAEHRDSLRARLNIAYDTFVARHGPINRTLQTVTSRSERMALP